MSAILLVNWVTISRKQVYQLAEMGRAGHQVVALTNNLLGDSARWVGAAGDSAVFVQQPPGLWARLKQLRAIVRHHSPVRCAIVPPEGRYSVFALAALRLWGVPVVCVEWGSIARLADIPAFTRWGMRRCYRHAQVVWFKEPYMEPLLRGLTRQPLHFLPNAVEMPETAVRSFAERQTLFAWANRLVAGRSPEWFVKAANQIAPVTARHAVLMGLLPEQVDDAMQQRCQALAGPSVSLAPFGDPLPLWADSRFFVLAADQVFGNNALLESMAAGVVPIVTESPGVSQVVQHGVNGWVCARTEAALEAAMSHAQSLSEAEWQRMSVAAREHVAKHYSTRGWGLGFRQLESALVLTPREP